MSEINIKRNHDAGLEQARSAAIEVAEKISEDYGIDYHWEQECLFFSRPGVDGRIEISDAHIEISAKLGFLVAVFKHSIEAEITRKLDRLFS
jgi:putative polyhydroxyalkanoate system protein